MKKWRGDSDKIKPKKRQALSGLLVNVAEGLSAEEQREIAILCLEDFETDRMSRQAWDAMHADWVAVYNQQDSAVNRPWPGSSDESIGLLTEACNSFAARAYKAFFPSRMPVAAIPVGVQSQEMADRAKRVGQFLQWALFVKDQSYKEDKAAMLLRTAIHGSDFTKTYFDPVLNKITVRPVRVQDLYVPYSAGPVSIEDVPRKTELIHLPLNEGRIRAAEGYFLAAPEPMMIGQMPSVIQEQVDLDVGITPSTATSEDYAQIIEQHRDLDLDQDGIAEPYKVWVDVTGQRLLRVEVRYEVDERGRPVNGFLPIEEYTHYRFLVNPDGFYGFGLGFMLGKANIAVNKLLRQFIDATTLSIHGNMSGFISENLAIAKGPVKLELGSFKSVSASTDDIQKGIKTLSFPAPPQQVIQALSLLESRAQRIGATTDAVSGDVDKVLQPNTVSQLIDQALTVFTSVQEFLLNAWSKELNKIYKLNSLYFQGYETFMNLTPTGPEASFVSQEDFAVDMMIMPVADPRLASQQARVQKAQFLFEFATKNPLIASNQQAMLAVSRRLLEEMEIDQIDQLLPQSVEELPPPPPDPKAIAEQQKAQVEAQKLQLEAQKAQQTIQLEAQKMQVDQQMKQASMVADQQIQAARVENERVLQELRIQNEAEIARMKQEYENVRAQQELIAKQAIEAQKAKLEADARVMVARIAAAGADVPDIEAQTSQAAMIADQIGRQMEALLERIQTVESSALGRHTETLSRLQDALATMSAPKRIVRGEDGRAIRVEIDRRD